MFTCYRFRFTRNSSINPNYLSWVLGFLHSYFYIVTFFTCFLFCFFQIPGASLSPKLSAFQTLSHTELSDNSPQPSGTIMVLKSVEIDPVDPGMNYFSFSSPFLHSRGEGGKMFSFPSLWPITYFLDCLLSSWWDKTFSIKLVMGYFLFFT